MALGGIFNPQSSTLSSAPSASVVPQQAQPTAPQTQPQQSWWSKLLPTAGAIGGGVLGEFVDPLGGGIAGAAIGSSLGRMGENAASGQKVLQGNDITAGLEGAVGQGAGEALGGVLGAAGGVLSKTGENAAEAASKATADAAEQDATRQATEEAVDKATATKLNYDVMNNKLQRLWNVGSNGKFLDEMGIDSSNPYEMQRAAGAGLEMNQVVDNALQQAKPISIQDSIRGAINAAPRTGSMNRIDLSGTALGRALQNGGIAMDASGNLPKVVPATTVRQFMQSVGDEIGNSQKVIQSSIDSGINPIEEETRLSQLNDVYTNLRDKLAKNPEVNEAIKNTTVSPEDQEILSEKYGPKLGSHVTNIINNAKNYDDVVPAMQQFAQMNNASKLAIDDIENGVGDRALQRVKLAGKEKTPVLTQNVADANKAEATNHVQDALGHIASNRPGAAIASTMKAVNKVKGPIADKTGSMLQRMSLFTGDNSGTVASKVLPAAGAGIATTPNTVSSPLSQIPGQPTAPGIAPSTSLTSPTAQTYNTALGMMTLDPYLASSMAPVLQNLAPQLQKAQGAEATLQGTEQAYQAAGGGQGLLGGTLAKIGGALTGGPTKTYTQEANQLAQQLQALGIPATYIPQITQSVVSGKLGFSELQQLIQAYGGGGTLGNVPSNTSMPGVPAVPAPAV